MNPNTIFVSDGASFYDNIKFRLPELIDRHERVIHSDYEFTNSNGYTTNHIESIWSELKRFIPSPGCNDFLCSKLDMFTLMWNLEITRGDSLFDFILGLLRN